MEIYRRREGTGEGAKHAFMETWEVLPQAVIDPECESFHKKLRKVILCGRNNNFNC